MTQSITVLEALLFDKLGVYYMIIAQLKREKEKKWIANKILYEFISKRQLTNGIAY